MTLRHQHPDLYRVVTLHPAGPRLLWNVKAARGSLRSIVAIPSSSTAGAGLQFGSGGGSALLATAGADGAVRVWRGADGKLLQSIESAHYRWVVPCLYVPCQHPF
jgi:hypothetical protein